MISMPNTSRPLKHCCVKSVLLVALFPLPSCLDGGQSIRELPPDGEDLPILEQFSRPHSHETRPMQLVIRDPAMFARFPFQDVAVDFEHEMLLIVTLGRVPSDQYAVSIDRVWREGHKLQVTTTVQAPAAGAPLSMASPYCIAVIPRCDLNVVGFETTTPQRVRSWSQSEPALGF